MILAFSLFLYLLLRTTRTALTQSLAILFLCVTVVYGGDFLVNQVTTRPAVLRWLRFQWLGIAFVPAAYFHFAEAVLETTMPPRKRRRFLVAFNYFVSAVVWLLAWFTDLIVCDGNVNPPVSQLSAGPYFWVFVVYFFGTLLLGFAMIYNVRKKYHSDTVRRRLLRLALSFAAPGISVFPYLAVAGSRHYLSPDRVLLLSLVGNVGIGFMLVVMAYTVSYYGILTQDRVIKHDLVEFLLRGPFVASILIGIVLSTPVISQLISMPPLVTAALGVAIGIIVMEVLIEWTKPLINWIAYRKDWQEISWLDQVDRRLLTSADLKQIMEGALIGLCETTGAIGGFISVFTDKGLRTESTCGDIGSDFERFLSQGDLPTLLETKPNGTSIRGGERLFVSYDGYLLMPLRTRERGEVLGIIGLRVDGKPELSPGSIETMRGLVQQVERAIEDRLIQQGIFLALQRIMPDIERVQRWRRSILYRTSGSSLSQENYTAGELDITPEFMQWVKDALAHYWGGPKLQQSPLLRLKVVSEAARKEGTPIKALRRVLQQAVEQLRPEGERKMTAPEWVLYNIVDLKFIQGKRTKEVADKLAMSESDLYRKQRIAIAEVARALAQMNAQGSSGENANEPEGSR